MNKEILKRIIVEKQEEIAAITLMRRSFVFEESANYVFIGIRRAGKSYLMYQRILELIEKQCCRTEDILYINFEDERLSTIQASQLGLLLDAYNELYDKKPILFLDEIQNVIGWEKFVRRLADSHYRIYVTGSNATMLSREIHTTLGGRFLVHEVAPFTFREYLTYHQVVFKKNWQYGSTREQVVRRFDEYFRNGGFAELFEIVDKRSWLNSLYQKILLSDIALRYGIRNERALRILVKKLAENVLQPTSQVRLKNVVAAAGVTVSRSTLADYLSYLIDAYLIFDLPNYSAKISERETTKKRYFSDNGLLKIFLIDPEVKLLENLIAIKLKRDYGEGVFYYRHNVEVDFFIPEVGRAVQACYDLTANDTHEREVKALLSLAKNFATENLEIVTYNQEEEIREQGKIIRVIPLWKWLLCG